MNPEVVRALERIVGQCEARLTTQTTVLVDGLVALERRARERELDGLRRQVLELAALNQQNAERIRALERVEDHRADYVPPEVLKRLEGLRDRLRAIHT